MQIIGLAKKVTVYIGESDRWGRKPLYMAVLDLLKQEDCAGATVTRGLAGFGAHSRIHTASLVALSADLPLVIEWVDSPERVSRVMPRLREMVTEGLITVQDVEVVTYSHRRLQDLPADIPVQNVMRREVHTVQPDTPLADAVEMLLDKVYRTLPVVDGEGRPVGIVTDGDLLKRASLLAVSAQRQLTRDELTAELRRLRQSGQTVADVMTRNPVLITASASLAEAVGQLQKHGIKRLPVVDAEGRLVGIISRADILRALARPPVAELPRQNPPPGRHALVKDIMLTNVPTVHADAPLAQVVDLLVGSARRRVVVVDDQQRVVGIITDGDLLKRATETERPGIIQSLTRRKTVGGRAGLHLQQRTAAEVMTPNPICVQADTPLLTALQLLLSHHIKRLPVVDRQGVLVGLLGRAGILQVLARELED
ncbi:MAG: CBS domain-containing protein [Chloroflexi bacterium]|nr:MAG: CBS domain-containing protein [Chloroflexota bacterium]